MLLYLFHNFIIGLRLYYALTVFAVVLTPELVAAAISSSSQSHLYQALNDSILGRAAPTAGKIFNLISTSLQEPFHDEYNSRYRRELFKGNQIMRLDGQVAR